MYLTTIRKELLHNILSLRYALVFFLFLVLTVTATVIRTAHYQKQVQDHRQARTEWFESASSALRWWQSMGLGVSLEKTPNPLSIFAAGLENEITRSYSISDWALPRTGERKLSTPSFRYTLTPDIVLIVNFVCSLLALLLIFDAVCGEREQGTLRVLLAGPLPRDVILVSKIAAGLITLLLPLALAWLASLGWALLAQGVILSAEQSARLAWIVALSALYVTFFFALGMCISCWTRRSATSLALGLLCWIVLVLAVPNLVPLVVNHLAPIPPESKITLEKDAFFARWESELQTRIYAELSATGKYDNNEDELWSELRKRQEEMYQLESEKIDKYYNSRISRQLRLNQEFSRLSPAAAYVYATTHFAGTGLRDFLRLLDDVDAYQTAFVKLSKELAEARRKKEEQKQNRWYDVPHDAYSPSIWPEFKPDAIGLAAVVRTSALDVILLAGATVVLLLLSVVGFMRYDPR